MRPLYFLGRLAAWITFPPIGLWRSLRHGRKSSERRLAREIGRELENGRRSPRPDA